MPEEFPLLVSFGEVFEPLRNTKIRTVQNKSCPGSKSEFKQHTVFIFTQMEAEKNDDIKPKVNNYVRYSSMVFQMAAVIALGVWGGRKLDQYMELKFPAFTLIFLFIAIFGGMYWTLKDLIKKK